MTHRLRTMQSYMQTSEKLSFMLIRMLFTVNLEREFTANCKDSCMADQHVSSHSLRKVYWCV